MHDIADWKFQEGNEDIGPKIAKDFLKSLNLDITIIEHVCQIIKNISFKGQKSISSKLTLEGQIVQDADRLDALGAIGIARTFAFGGYKQRAIYNPEIDPKIYATSDEYRKNTAPTINHFYEKLLLLKDMMNTKTASKLAIGRHNFLEQFLERFFKEIEGEL